MLTMGKGEVTGTSKLLLVHYSQYETPVLEFT